MSSVDSRQPVEFLCVPRNNFGFLFVHVVVDVGDKRYSHVVCVYVRMVRWQPTAHDSYFVCSTPVPTRPIPHFFRRVCHPRPHDRRYTRSESKCVHQLMHEKMKCFAGRRKISIFILGHFRFCWAFFRVWRNYFRKWCQEKMANKRKKWCVEPTAIASMKMWQRRRQQQLKNDEINFSYNKKRASFNHIFARPKASSASALHGNEQSTVRAFVWPCSCTRPCFGCTNPKRCVLKRELIAPLHLNTERAAIKRE